ncbi:MAG TPA: hypothetical protein VK473_05485, partial [Terriglobales bacterium]|nr:hypothetical protein [Terriglobales bacterium]
TTGLYLKLLQTGETHAWPLPKDFSAHIDSWFPDSAHVLIDHVETAGAQPSLWTASVLGGEPRKVADDAEAGVVSPDGSYIAFTRVPQGREEIWVMRTDGMEQTKVVPAVRDDYLGRTTWSSDGRKIAYVRRRLTGYMQTTDTIEVNEWRNGHSHILLSQERLGFALLWLPDSRIVYTRAEDVPSERDLNAWAVTVDKSGRVSGAPRRLMRGIGSIAEITADADGRLMVFRRIQQQNQVVAGTLSPDGRRLVGTKRLTLDENQNLPFAWTPDSKSVLFSSDRNGSVAIFKQAIDQPLPELLATSSEGEWTSRTIPRLTPDGSEAVYLAEPKIARSGSVSAIAAISLQGGAPRIILRGEKIGNIECARLPSTVCIYAVEVGDHATFLQFDVRSGVSSELTTIDISGGVPMNWGLSPDGSKLAIILHTPNANTIQLRSLVTGKTYDLTVKGWSGVLCVDWAADSNSLFVTTSNLARQNALLRVMLDGSASLLGEGGKNQFINWAIPSPDGRMLALNEAAGTSNVWAVEKF